MRMHTRSCVPTQPLGETGEGEGGKRAEVGSHHDQWFPLATLRIC
jgi:hypothetical protein